MLHYLLMNMIYLLVFIIGKNDYGKLLLKMDSLNVIFLFIVIIIAITK